MTNKNLSGVELPNGSLRKQTQSSFYGLVVPTGSLSAAPRRYLSIDGTLSPLGTLFNKVDKSLSGLIVPTGRFTKLVDHYMVGDAGFFGDLLTQRSLYLGGSLDPVGDLVASLVNFGRLFRWVDPDWLPVLTFWWNDTEYVVKPLYWWDSTRQLWRRATGG